MSGDDVLADQIDAAEAAARELGSATRTQAQQVLDQLATEGGPRKPVMPAMSTRPKTHAAAPPASINIERYQPAAPVRKRTQVPEGEADAATNEMEGLFRSPTPTAMDQLHVRGCSWRWWGMVRAGWGWGWGWEAWERVGWLWGCGGESKGGSGKWEMEKVRVGG